MSRIWSSLDSSSSPSSIEPPTSSFSSPPLSSISIHCTCSIASTSSISRSHLLLRCTIVEIRHRLHHLPRRLGPSLTTPNDPTCSPSQRCTHAHVISWRAPPERHRHHRPSHCHRLAPPAVTSPPRGHRHPIFLITNRRRH